MSYLIDTHVFLWALNEPEKLSKRVRDFLTDTDSQAFVSASTCWEISTKFRIGKLNVDPSLGTKPSLVVESFGFPMLDIKPAHADLAGAMQGQHRDPFDRILAAQSKIESMPLVTKDPALSQFDIETIW